MSSSFYRTLATTAGKYNRDIGIHITKTRVQNTLVALASVGITSHMFIITNEEKFALFTAIGDVAYTMTPEDEEGYYEVTLYWD